MTKRNPDTVRAALEEIEGVLRNSTCGWNNETARAKIRTQIGRMDFAASGDGYISEKTGSLATWLEILYSVSKWQEYGDSPDRVRSFMIEDCSKIRSWVATGWAEPSEERTMHAE